MSEFAAEMRGVRFAYTEGEGPVFQLDALTVAPGETVVLTGESGAGKSTVLGLLCGVLRAAAGSITVAERALSGQSGARRDRIRADHVGYVFQRSNLLPYISPVQNVLLAGQFSQHRRLAAGKTDVERRAHAEGLLQRLGLEDLGRAASTLSAGQQQRVAAARALYGEPALLVGDEPTAALDTANRDRFLELFLGEAERTGAGVLIVSHDRSIVPLFDRHVELPSIARWEAH